MSTGRYMAALVVCVALAFGAPAAWADGPGETQPEASPPTETGPTTSTPTPTTTEPTPPPGTGTTPALTPPPGTAPTTGTPGCFLGSAGLICPGNPGCVVTSAGVTCASNCAVTSAGLVCPRGAVLGNPPVRGGGKPAKARKRKSGRQTSAPVSTASPTTIPVSEPGGARELPFTGEPLLPIVGLGVALLVAGLLLLRRGTATAPAAVEPARVAAPLAVAPRGRRRDPSRVLQSLAVVALLWWRRPRRRS